MESTIRREYLLNLPLPLAKLYSHAQIAKDVTARHHHSFGNVPELLFFILDL